MGTSEKAPHKRLSRWFWLGPLLGLLAVGAVVGGAMWWKHHQFEKERTETAPHVVADLKLKLLWIPDGTFTMGTDDEAEWLKSLKKKFSDVKSVVKDVVFDQTPSMVVALTTGGGHRKNGSDAGAVGGCDG